MSTAQFVPSTEPSSAATEPVSTATRSRERCAVCEHDLSDHDAISLRYCHATQAQALSRNCICSTA